MEYRITKYGLLSSQVLYLLCQLLLPLPYHRTSSLRHSNHLFLLIFCLQRDSRVPSQLVPERGPELLDLISQSLLICPHEPLPRNRKLDGGTMSLRAGCFLKFVEARLSSNYSFDLVTS